MGEDNIPLLQAMTRKMGWHEQRQNVITANISNADTPRYMPSDLSPLDFKSLLRSSAGAGAIQSVGLATTRPNHINSSGSLAKGDKSRIVKDRDIYEVSPSGNAVILEEQLFKMNSNQADHALISNLYQKNIQMIKQAEK